MVALEEDFKLEDLDFDVILSPDEINVLIELDEIEKAESLVLQALKHNPNNIEYTELLIKIYKKKSKLKKAKDLALDTLKKYPDNREIYGELIDINILQGEYNTAHEMIDSALNSDSIDPFIFGQMITLLHSEEKFEDALHLAEDMSKKFPSNENIKGRVVNFLLGTNNLNRALTMVNSAISMYRSELGDVLETDVLSNNVMQYFDLKTIKKIKGYLLTMRQYIQICIKQKDYDVAEKTISDMSKKFPDSNVIKEQEINLLIAQKKYNVALEKAMELLAKNRNNEVVKSSVIIIYSRTQEFEKANAMIQKDLNDPDTNIQTYKTRVGQAVYILTEQGKSEEAALLGRKYGKEIPCCRILRSKVVDILIDLQQIDEAASLNEELVIEYPNASNLRRKQKAMIKNNKRCNYYGASLNNRIRAI